MTIGAVSAIIAIIQSVLLRPGAPTSGRGDFLPGLGGHDGLLGGEMEVSRLSHALTGDIHCITEVQPFSAADAVAILLGGDGEVKVVLDNHSLVPDSKQVTNKLSSEDEKAKNLLARLVLESGTVCIGIMEHELEVFNVIEEGPEILDLFLFGSAKRNSNNSAIASPSMIHCRQYLSLDGLHGNFAEREPIVPGTLVLKALDGSQEVGELVERHDDSNL
jgi:hypothetical protein